MDMGGHGNYIIKVELRFFTSNKSTDSFNGLIGGINSKAIPPEI